MNASTTTYAAIQRPRRGIRTEAAPISSTSTIPEVVDDTPVLERHSIRHSFPTRMLATARRATARSAGSRRSPATSRDHAERPPTLGMATRSTREAARVEPVGVEDPVVDRGSEVGRLHPQVGDHSGAEDEGERDPGGRARFPGHHGRAGGERRRDEPAHALERRDDAISAPRRSCSSSAARHPDERQAEEHRSRAGRRARGT